MLLGCNIGVMEGQVCEGGVRDCEGDKFNDYVYLSDGKMIVTVLSPQVYLSSCTTYFYLSIFLTCGHMRSLTDGI